jgi:TonB family protein
MLNPTLNRQVLSRQTKLLATVVAFLLLLPLAALRVRAQDLSGPLTGSIYDPSGAHIPNATIIMTNWKTNLTDMTTSGTDGNFEFKVLPAGEYQMEVVKPGFAEYKAPHVVLVAGREALQTVTLNVGAVTEEVDVVAVGTAKTSTEEAGHKTIRVRIGGDVQAPKIITKVQPVYPEAAKAAGTQGTVLLHAVIGMNGNPLSLRVMNSEVDPQLARAAVEAVSQWRYRPTLLNGEPIEVDTTITVNFKLMP